MAKISELPTVEAPIGTEPVVVLSNGEAKTAPVQALVEAAFVAPKQAAAAAMAVQVEQAGVERAGAQKAHGDTQALFDKAQSVLHKLTGPEANAGAIYRILWGHRELARHTKAAGWLFHKLRLSVTTTLADYVDWTLPQRILRPSAREVGSHHRIIIGTRLFADVTTARGVYPRRLTIPATARIDDDLSRTLVERLGIGSGPSPAGRSICLVGDSLTAGTDADYLAQLTGRTVRNLGVGGETSRTIVGRMGVWPILVTVDGGAIPAAGGVTVTLVSVDGGAVSPLLQHVTNGLASINPCVVEGVTGTLTRAGDVLTFTRSTGGAVVPVPFPGMLTTSAYRERRGDIHILEMGQNGGYVDLDQLVAQQRAMDDWSDYLLVRGFSTGTAASRAEADDKMLRAFGRRFVNIRAFLSSPAAMAHAGLTPTQADLDAQAVGRVPPALLSDPVHLNNPGSRAKEWFTARRLKELEWI